MSACGRNPSQAGSFFICHPLQRGIGFGVQMEQNDRRHEIEEIRAIALSLLIPYHIVSLSISPPNGCFALSIKEVNMKNVSPVRSFGVRSVKQRMLLFLEMALAELPDNDAAQVRGAPGTNSLRRT